MGIKRIGWASVRLWYGSGRKREGGTLGAAGFWGHPAKEEEVTAAQFAPVGEEDPVDGFLQGVAGAYAPELDGSAVRTVGGHICRISARSRRVWACRHGSGPGGWPRGRPRSVP